MKTESEKCLAGMLYNCHSPEFIERKSYTVFMYLFEQNDVSSKYIFLSEEKVKLCSVLPAG